METAYLSRYLLPIIVTIPATIIGNTLSSCHDCWQKPTHRLQWP